MLTWDLLGQMSDSSSTRRSEHDGRRVGIPSMHGGGLVESVEEQRRRFEIECEFVQSLANPNYLNFLAQRGYFKEEYFINYLKYLLYWKRPEYARCLKYPQCLFMLEAVQDEEFRKNMESGAAAKFIEDQMILQWQYYLRKRQRLHENPPSDVDEGEGSSVKPEPAEEAPAADE